MNLYTLHTPAAEDIKVGDVLAINAQDQFARVQTEHPTVRPRSRIVYMIARKTFKKGDKITWDPQRDTPHARHRPALKRWLKKKTFDA